MFKSAIVKLTAWYLLSTLTLSLIFSIVIYKFSINEINEALHNQYLVTEFPKGTNFDQFNYHSQALIRSHQLLGELIYFNLVVLVLASFLSFMLAKKTLRPIREAHEDQIKFTAEASHELRTPISAMKADTESVLMMHNPDNKLLKDTLEANLTDLSKLELLTNHLLDIARYRSIASHEIVSIDLEKLILELKDDFKHRLKEKGIKLELKAIKITVKSDILSVRLLISIILDNAIKYSLPNSVITIEISHNKNFIEIAIIDTGVGISVEALKHIFEPFYRSKSIDDKSNSGFGLGLTLANDIAKLLKGKLELDSNLGTGTTVKILLKP